MTLVKSGNTGNIFKWNTSDNIFGDKALSVEYFFYFNIM